MEVVIEQLQVYQRIPGVIAFSERVRLTGEHIEPITQRPVEPFHMDRPSRLRVCPQGGKDLYGQQTSMLITMLDRLRQRHRRRDYPRRTSPFAWQVTLARSAHEHAAIAVPSITEPVQFASVSSLHGGGHCLLDEVLTQRTGGPGHHEATVPILDEAAPAFSLVRLPSCAVFFCTNAALLIDFDLAQVQIGGQYLRDGCRMDCCSLEPCADRLVCVSRDLFGRT